MINEHIPVITIDGPSGTGKGTICHLLAERLGWNILDSGALYRVLALAAEQHTIALDNEIALGLLAEHLDVQFKPAAKNNAVEIILEGKIVTEAIRTESCGNRASILAALPGVRKALLARQRAFRESPGLVTDGRDMGTVIFPNADVKLYLTATAEIRAERRFNQLKEKGINVTLAQVVKELAKRDQRDQLRDTSPLKPAADAFIFDTTHLSIEEVLNKTIQTVEQRLGVSVE